MKKLLYLLVFMSSLAVGQEKYHVIHVKGKVTVKESGKILKPKDVISAEQEIVFGGKADMLAVLSTKRGRYILKPKSSTSGESELTAFVSDALNSSSGKLSTRSVLNTVLDMQNYFHGSHVFLDGSASILINTKVFPLSEEKFFFISYDYNGEAINKKLSHDGDHLIFSKEELFKVDGNSIYPDGISNYQLFFFEADLSARQRIGQFTPVFPTNESLLNELSIIDSMMNFKNEKERYDEYFSYIQETYGKVLEADLKEFIATHKK